MRLTFINQLGRIGLYERKRYIFEQTTKFNTGIKLYMFQTGSIKTKLKFIKMNQSDEPMKYLFHGF